MIKFSSILKTCRQSMLRQTSLRQTGTFELYRDRFLTQHRKAISNNKKFKNGIPSEGVMFLICILS